MVLITIHPLNDNLIDYRRICSIVKDVLEEKFSCLSSPTANKILVLCSLFEFEEHYFKRLEWFIKRRKSIIVFEKIDSLSEIHLKAFVSA